MHVRHLTVADFRSYASAELPLEPGVTTLVGLNGQGKTNLVEAIGYLATLSSHRVSTDQPLVRFGAEQAVIRGAVVRDGRETMLELELNPGRANRARLGPLPRVAAARGAGHAAHRALRARGPRPGQGRPVGAPPVPRRPARRAPTAVGRRAQRLRQDPQAAQRPAQVGTTVAAQGISTQATIATRPTSRSTTPAPPPCTPSTSGTTTSPPSGRSCSTPGCGCCATWVPISPRPTTRSAPASPTPGSPTRARCVRRPRRRWPPVRSPRSTRCAPRSLPR